jgi:hypothetical protein
MYIGSFGGVSNQEDWSATISLINDDNSNFNATGAEILMRLCREGNSVSAVLTAQTDDGSITIAADGSSFSWTIPRTTMSQLRPEVYNIFARMSINGGWTQLVSATLTVIDGGPSS